MTEQQIRDQIESIPDTREGIIKYGIEEVFNNKKDKFESWYNRVNEYYGNIAPKEMSEKELKSLLIRMDHGVYI